MKIYGHRSIAIVGISWMIEQMSILILDEKCTKCGQNLVHLVHLQSSSNYLFCPNIHQSILSDFKSNGKKIFCCRTDEENSTFPEANSENCIYCNQELVRFAFAQDPFQRYEICPSVLGFFFQNYRNQKNAAFTKVFCETRIEIEAQYVEPLSLSLSRGIKNYPLATVKTSNVESLSGLSLNMEVPAGWPFLVSPNYVPFQPPYSESTFSIYITIPENVKPGDYFIRYKPVAQRMGRRKMGPNEVIKGFDKPTIIKITVR